MRRPAHGRACVLSRTRAASDGHRRCSLPDPVAPAGGRSRRRCSGAQASRRCRAGRRGRGRRSAAPRRRAPAGPAPPARRAARPRGWRRARRRGSGRPPRPARRARPAVRRRRPRRARRRTAGDERASRSAASPRRWRSWPPRRDVSAAGEHAVGDDRPEVVARADSSSRARYAASWAGAASSVDTTTNVVRGSPSRASTSRARATKPFSIAWKRMKNSAMSCRKSRPEHAVGDLVERLRGHVEQARPVRHGEPAQQPAAEELDHPRRGVEHVEGVARRRRVDDDEVVLARWRAASCSCSIAR